jgi:hypothetical protein
MAVREGRWDCQYCGTKGNLGRHKACQKCGRSRPSGAKFYLPSDEEAAVLDANLLKLAKAGQDWVCEFCGSSNHTEATICHYCGAPREGTSPVQEIKEYDLSQTPESGDMTFDETPERPRSQPESTPKKSKRPLLIIGGVLLGLILLCALIFAGIAIFSGKDVDASVSGFQWNRSINVEAYQTVTEEDWSVPSDGRTIDQRQEIHHYDTILDHYETRQREIQVQVGEETYVCGQRDLGNGFFEDIKCTDPIYETQIEEYEEAVNREEPVYETFYTYEIDKWLVVRSESESGRDHNAQWPQLNLAETEREGTQSESYIIFFVNNDDEEYSLELPFSEWQDYEMGQNVLLKLDVFGNLDEVEP